jgi:uncharacterized protein (DUF697 family)
LFVDHRKEIQQMQAIEVTAIPSAINIVSRPALGTIYRLEERNRIASDFIRSYANRHAKMDVAVGLLGLIPPLGIPALAGAIAAQSPLIYRPLASDLAKIYMAQPGDLEDVQKKIVHTISVETGLCDIAADFGAEFMMQIAGELLTEAGWGVLATMCVPVVGGAVGAALDYLIATQMTWRVGTMVSMYFQNGGEWVESQKHTFKLAKEMTGSMHVGVGDLLDGKFKNHTPRIDLNDIRKNVPSARENLLRNVHGMVTMLRAAANDKRVREILQSQGIPLDLVDAVLAQPK